ncbi:MAG: hypothetical protein ACFBZ9_10760 [Sphingomonadales bacterium]
MGAIITPLKTVFGIDLRSLAAFRVMISLYIIADVVNRWEFLRVFYTDYGILSRAAAMGYNHPARWSLLYLNGEPWVIHLIFAFTLFTALCLLIGYRTRLATVLSFVMMASITNRNLILNQGGDDLCCALLFWAIFLPLGARFSVDDAMRPEHESQPVAVQGPANPYFSIASIAALLQVSYVYVFGAFLKTGDAWHKTHDAIYYALSAESVSSALGERLLDVEWLLQPMTQYVYWLELLMPLYVFTPIFFVFFRTLGVAALIALHLGFALFLSVGLFPLISISSLMLLIPGAVWNRFVLQPGWSLFYDRDCAFCRKTCLLLRSFCLPRETPIQPAQDDAVAGPILEANKSWVVITPSGETVLSWKAVRRVLKANPLTYPVGLLAALLPNQLGKRFYDYIGNSRGALGRVTAILLPYQPAYGGASGVAIPIVGLLTVFIFLWNVSQDANSGLKLPDKTEYAAKFLHLNQRWDMFAPKPILLEGWFAFEGTLENGLHVDLWTGKPGYPPVTAPDNLRDWNKDYRWRKYLSRIHKKAYSRQRPNLARYWCKQKWADRSGETQALESVRMTYYGRWTQADGRPDRFKTYPLYNHSCN